MDINRLKKFDASMYEMEELVGIKVELDGLMAGFSNLQLEMPAWVADKTGEVKLAINALAKAQRDNERRRLKAEMAGLMTREERRNAIQARLDALNEAEIV